MVSTSTSTHTNPSSARTRVGSFTCCRAMPPPIQWHLIDLGVALIFMEAVIVRLAGPVIAGALFDFFSGAAEQAAPTAFFLGLGLLFAGLIFRARILDIAGACLIGLVLIGVVLDNYLPSQAQDLYRLGRRVRGRAPARGYGAAGRAPARPRTAERIAAIAMKAVIV